MLLSFRFANYRSFRDETHLLLTPAYRSQDRAVRVVGIFGANASGKSNLLGALSFMSNFVGSSDRESEPGLGVRHLAFRLDPGSVTQPSYYTVDLLLEGIRHTYGFSVSSARVVDEWLYTYPKGARRKIFERKEDHYTWGEYTKGTFLEELSEVTAPTALLMSVAARFGRFRGREPDSSLEDGLFLPFHRTYQWLYQRVRTPSVNRYSRFRRPLLTGFTEDDPRFPLLIELLRSADLGLMNMSWLEPEDDEEKLDSLTSRRQLQFHHRGVNGDVLFDATDESDGTIRLLELGVRAISTLRSGGLLLVDEIDASLHPLLTARVIELFQNPDTNIRGAQLVFSSHDATLLGTIEGREVLQRDEIWFVEKGRDGASTIYSLVEFRPRKEQENRQRRYLSGKYGAIPDVSMALFEKALMSRRDAIDV